MKRRLTPADVDRLVEIHATSWSSHELSVKLGPAFLRLFYSAVAADARSFGSVYEENGTVVGYAVGFHDYSGFNRRFASQHRWRLYRLLLWRLLTRRAGLHDLGNLVLEGRKMRRARFPDSHLGALALANEVKGTSTGKAAITAVIRSVTEELTAAHGGCSCICDARNIALRKYLGRLGLEQMDVIPLVRKCVVLYETPSL